MKFLFNLVALVAIITVYLVSISLYEQGNLFAAYSLILGSIISLIFWIQNVSQQLENKKLSVKMPSMSSLIRLMTLPAIVSIYILSVSLYVQGNLFASYSLVIGSLVALIFWIQNVSLLLQKQRA
jgi:hypothetical protein